MSPTQRFFAYFLDVSNPAELESLSQRIEATSGTPDLVIMSAGICYSKRFIDDSDASFEQVFLTNVMGSRAIANAFLPGMIAKQKGQLCFVSSMAGLVPVYGYSAYNTSKFALLGMAGALRQELYEYNISVSVLCPPEVDTPLIIDVVMESNHAGLDLIKWVRESLNNHTIRIVLRTGQPGEAPEESVIRDYDINDYKNKTELTALRLKTSIYSALRSYRDIKVIETHRVGLERIIDATSTFIECDSLSDFASAILRQISVVLGIEYNDIVCCALTREKLVNGHSKLNVLAHNSQHDNPLTPEIKSRIDEALVNKQNVMNQDFFVGYFTTKRGTENVLYVAKETHLEDFQHHLLSSFAHNIAVAHENLKLREVIKESQRELSYVIGEAVELRSKETGSHVKRVAHISHLLAVLYGMSERDAELIQLASPLHDVGKVGIPDVILNKPGPHSDDERTVMKTHAQIGYEMLCKSDNPILQLGAHIAHEHHECWDGSGYPRGLYQNEIHIAGRISAVADVFDALGSKRCYKQAWEDDAILAYFEQEKGKRFEPQLVDLLIGNIDKFRAIRQQFPDPA